MTRPLGNSVGDAPPAGLPRFDRDTAVTRLGDNCFAARMDRGWWIARGPNGGYVAAMLLRAIEAAVADPARAPRSLTVHFLAPPAEGEARIETCVERAGRSMTSVSARLLQDGRVLAVALAALSKPFADTHRLQQPPPVVPPPERLEPVVRNIPVHARYDVRIAIGDPPFSGSAEATLGGWIRLQEPRPVDALLLTAYADAISPAFFATLNDRSATKGVPTIDLTVHFRAPLPLASMKVDDFALAVFRSRYARDGFVEEDGEIWSADGQLLAQSRQLAVML
jgi:acyl-CoA thioesterase